MSFTVSKSLENRKKPQAYLMLSGDRLSINQNNRLIANLQLTWRKRDTFKELTDLSLNLVHILLSNILIGMHLVDH